MHTSVNPLCEIIQVVVYRSGGVVSKCKMQSRGFSEALLKQKESFVTFCGAVCVLFTRWHSAHVVMKTLWRSEDDDVDYCVLVYIISSMKTTIVSL